MTTLNYITDRPIDGQAANAIARKSMAQSFSLLKDVLNVNFVFVSNSNDFEKTEEQEKLNVKPIVMRTYKEQSFSEGKPSGKWVEYYIRGNKKAEGEYKGIYKNGVWSYWDEKGNLILRLRYKNGVKEEVIYDVSSAKALPKR